MSSDPSDVDSIEQLRAVLRSEERRARARRVAARTRAELAAETAAAAEAAAERDPREDEAWFQRLPEDVAEATREGWRREAQRHVVSTPVYRARRRRIVLESAVLLVALVAGIGAYRGVLDPLAILVAIGLGTALGLVLFHGEGGRFAASLLGLAGVAAALGLPGVVRGLSDTPGLFDALGGMYGWVLTAGVFAVYGQRLEFRRLDPDEAHAGLSAARLETLSGRRPARAPRSVVQREPADA